MVIKYWINIEDLFSKGWKILVNGKPYSSCWQPSEWLPMQVGTVGCRCVLGMIVLRISWVHEKCAWKQKCAWNMKVKKYSNITALRYWFWNESLRCVGLIVFTMNEAQIMPGWTMYGKLWIFIGFQVSELISVLIIHLNLWCVTSYLVLYSCTLGIKM